MANENILVVENNATLLRVVESVLSRAEFKVASAPDPGASLALARASAPALILIDSLMAGASDMGDEMEAVSAREIGVRLCRDLVADADLSKIPVVLMVPRGEDVEGRYAQTPNVVDYITKPFSPDALLTVVEQAISGRTSTDVAPPPLDAWSASQAAVAVPAATEETDAELAGDLQTLPVSEVLSLLGRQQGTGVLTIFGNAARLELVLRGGCLELASATGVGAEFLLGRFIIEASGLAPMALEAAIGQLQADAETEVDSQKPALLGRQLVEQGTITAGQLAEALRRQTVELVCESLRWTEGRFRFRRREVLPAPATEAALGLPIDAILLEGFRRVDEWHRIERGIRNFDLVFVRDEARLAGIARGSLTRDEIVVLDALDGRHSVRDVIRSLRMGSYDVTRILFLLREMGLVRPRVEPVATPIR
jgi:CheY-like chemotaxis protein